MLPNYFALKGSGANVNYALGPARGFPELKYTDGAFERIFGPDQIESNNTGLGELVSVPLLLSVDAGGHRFGFFLPSLNITAADQTVNFRTVGIYETFSGPNSVPRRPSTWRCIEMTGTAQIVDVPI